MENKTPCKSDRQTRDWIITNIKNQARLQFNEARLMLEVILFAVEDVFCVNPSHRRSAREFLKTDMWPYSDLCELDPDWIRKTIYSVGVDLNKDIKQTKEK